MDTSDDFVMPTPKVSQPLQRTLLLSPPSLSSHQEKLTNVLQSYDRSVTDLQMLDRLSLGLVSLPPSTYDLILILSDADGTRTESRSLLGRAVFSLLVAALKDGGKLCSQDGQLGSSDVAEKNEGILAGLSFEPAVGFVKPTVSAQETVPLKFGRKNASKAAGGLSNGDPTQVSLPLNGKRKVVDDVPAGVGFDDGNNDSDDELIDEDELMEDEDFQRPLKIRELLSAVPRFSILTTDSNRVPAQGQEATSMQRLHMRTGRKTRGRGSGEERECRQGIQHTEITS